MLKPLPIDQIEARNMESVAVLKTSLDRFHDVAGWEVSRGSDDLDDFDGAVFDLAGVGAVGVVRYDGLPPEVSTVLAPQGMAPAKIARLIRKVIAAGRLKTADVAWLTPAVPTVDVASRDRFLLRRKRKTVMEGAVPRRLVG